MSQLIDPTQGLELRNATSGTVLGSFISRDELQELIAERDRLRHQLAALQVERDTYLTALYAFMRKEVTISEEELRDLQTNGIPLRETIDEIERIVAAGTPNGSCYAVDDDRKIVYFTEVTPLSDHPLSQEP
ncbi:MAG TPA: hypothetical protein VN688_04950 [Gemmataceae bacterium]|nr:hypothetical protein [Gemmataceae bacterium]